MDCIWRGPRLVLQPIGVVGNGVSSAAACSVAVCNSPGADVFPPCGTIISAYGVVCVGVFFVGVVGLGVTVLWFSLCHHGKSMAVAGFLRLIFQDEHPFMGVAVLPLAEFSTAAASTGWLPLSSFGLLDNWNYIGLDAYFYVLFYLQMWLWCDRTLRLPLVPCSI